MFAKYFDEYKRLSEKLKFLSKLAVFLISMALLISFYRSIEFYLSDRYSLVASEELEFLLYNLFQFVIFVVFASRFVLLFFKAKKVFWISQVLSIIGLILLSVYLFISIPSENFGMYPPPGVFNYASHELDIFGSFYLLLSPLKLFIISIIAFFKSK